MRFPIFAGALIVAGQIKPLPSETLPLYVTMLVVFGLVDAMEMILNRRKK